MQIELYVSDSQQTYNISEYANFMNSKIIYNLNVDDYSYYFEMRDIILAKEAANIFINPRCTFFNATVVFPEYRTNFSARISLEDVEFFENDYCKINIRLDNLDEFLASLQVITLHRTHRTLVLREPQRDSAALGFLLLAVSLSASIIFFVYSFANARLTAGAIASTGVGAPGAASYLTISYIILFIYLALYVVSLIQLARQISDFINAIRTNAYAFNLYNCALRIARIANMTIDTASITDVQDVYIVSPSTTNTFIADELITAAEIIDAIKKTLNARLYIFNNQIKFISVQNTTVPSVLRTAHVERFRYDTRDLQNIFLFSLQRDAAEGYSYVDIEAAYERRTQCAAGYKRISLPYAAHRIKNFKTFIDRAYEFLLATLFFGTAGLGAIAYVILRAINVLRQYDPKRGHIIVEAEGWIPKIIKTNNIIKPDIESENVYIRSIKDKYRNRLLRVVNTKVKLTPQEFYNLANNGFPSVRNLTYYVYDQYAEVEYEEEVPQNLPYTERFI